VPGSEAVQNSGKLAIKKIEEAPIGKRSKYAKIGLLGDLAKAGSVDSTIDHQPERCRKRRLRPLRVGAARPQELALAIMESAPV
jgi:hypothetical protein